MGSSRLKLLKVRAVTLHNTRRIRFLRSIGQGAILPRGIKARPRKRHLRIPFSLAGCAHPAQRLHLPIARKIDLPVAKRHQNRRSITHPNYLYSPSPTHHQHNAPFTPIHHPRNEA